MLKAIHAQEDLAEAQKKARAVADKLDNMKLRKAAQKVREGADETLSYYHCGRLFPGWQQGLDVSCCQIETHCWDQVGDTKVYEYGSFKRDAK